MTDSSRPRSDRGRAEAPEDRGYCEECEPVFGPERLGRTMPLGAQHVLDEATAAGDLWLGALEVRGDRVAAADLEFPEPAHPDPDQHGWVFQCAGCDRLGLVLQVPTGGSRVWPVSAWPTAPEPKTVTLRQGQYAALLYRIEQLEAVVAEELDELASTVGQLPAVLWEQPEAWERLLRTVHPQQ